MPGARKMFRSPFLLEKSKFNRVIEAAESRFKQAGLTPHLLFQVQLRGQKLIQTTAIEEVFAIDNSKKSRIEDIYVTCADAEPSDAPKEHIASIDFDGTAPASIVVAVRGKHSPWVSETFAALEEQAERTLQTSILNRLSYRGVGSAIGVILFLLASFAGVFSVLSIHEPTRLTNAMWLTDQDLKELEPLLSDANLSKEKASEVLSHQIRNVLRDRQQRKSVLTWAFQWRTIVAVVPFLAVLAALAYLYFTCYPHAVFLWGDAEDWYKDILHRRTVIWTSVIIAFGVGVLGNLFVLALHS